MGKARVRVSGQLSEGPLSTPCQPECPPALTPEWASPSPEENQCVALGASHFQVSHGRLDGKAKVLWLGNNWSHLYFAELNYPTGGSWFIVGPCVGKRCVFGSFLPHQRFQGVFFRNLDNYGSKFTKLWASCRMESKELPRW